MDNSSHPISSDDTQLSVEEAFSRAVASYNEENFVAAEQLSFAVVKAVPNHVDAINLLGLIAQRASRHDLAVEHFKNAVKINNRVATLFYNLATSLYPMGQRSKTIKALQNAHELDGDNLQIADYLNRVLNDSPDNLKRYNQQQDAVEVFKQARFLHDTSQFDNAIRWYEKSLELQPKYADAYINIALIQQSRGDLQNAAINFKKAIAIKPEDPFTHYNLGVVRQAQDSHKKAVNCFLKAVALNPGFAHAHGNLAFSYHKLGRFDDGVASCNTAINLDPDYQEAHYNLGVLLQEQKIFSKAMASFKRAVELNEGMYSAHYNMGVIFQAQGNFTAAIASYNNTISLCPDYAQAYYNIGVVLQEQGKSAQGILQYQKAIAINPDYAQAHNNLGGILHKEGQHQKGLTHIKKAISIKPDYAEAYYNLAIVLQEEGDFNSAIQSLKKAVEINADFAKAHSSLIFCLDHNSHLSTVISQLEREKWAKQHAKPLKALWSPHSNSPEPDRAIRIGYVGADFVDHSAAYIFGPMLLYHNPKKFQIFCYSGSEIEDDFTARFKQSTFCWRSTVGIDDAVLAQQIIQDRIDILVDLAGHTHGNRLLTFARKPAPIQITAWGYGLGTCMDAMDYLFADAIVIPEQERGKYSEEIIDLPCEIHLNSPEDFPQIKDPPVIKTGHITFGGFNRIEKYNREIYSLWAKILHRIPNAKLLIKAAKLDSASRVDEIQEIFIGEGISTDRLILIGKTGKQEHLESHNLVDIMLDPHPHNGGMTTLESLRMGVPVLSCETKANWPISASILHILGLDDWRVKDEHEYVDKAVEFAGNVKLLKSLRKNLRDRFDKSVLGNSQLYVNRVEAIYGELWQKWCEEQKKLR
ncbi:MAG: tetratricopeptide repeat protein [Magnetococcales bacterium]|nr:tetratricopeptide repeat protein [Magnetococcales bacterium]